jgi:hypothetical protein
MDPSEGRRAGADPSGHAGEKPAVAQAKPVLAPLEPTAAAELIPVLFRLGYDRSWGRQLRKLWPGRFRR